jgi:hypothetical protein
VGNVDQIRDERSEVVGLRRSALLPLAGKTVGRHHGADRCGDACVLGRPERDQVHGARDAAGQRRRTEPHVLQIPEPVTRRQHWCQALADVPRGHAVRQPDLEQLGSTLDPGRKRRAERQPRPSGVGQRDRQA